MIPKHAGGTDDPSNLVELTPEAHAEAHRKLYEEYGRWQDEAAWKGLSKSWDKHGVRMYASAETRRGVPLTDEHKANLSKSGMGRVVSDETRRRMSEVQRKKNNFHSNHKHSEESNRKRSEAQKGIPTGPFTEEHKAKLRKPKSEAGRKAIAEAQKKRRERERAEKC
jgi:hypothetical protein